MEGRLSPENNMLVQPLAMLIPTDKVPLSRAPKDLIVQGFFVTGTDTDVGKTLVSAWLLTQIEASYWKPIHPAARPTSRHRRRGRPR